VGTGTTSGTTVPTVSPVPKTKNIQTLLRPNDLRCHLSSSTFYSVDESTVDISICGVDSPSIVRDYKDRQSLYL